MKYIIVSLLFLSLILGLCIFSAYNVTQAVSQTTELLETAVMMHRQGNREATVAMVQAASAQWRSNDTFFGTVLRHDEIDDVMRVFAQLESYAKTEDEDDFLSNCASLLAQLQHIREMEWPHFKNIM